jgi:hypothetical protein
MTTVHIPESPVAAGALEDSRVSRESRISQRRLPSAKKSRPTQEASAFSPAT